MRLILLFGLLTIFNIANAQSSLAINDSLFFDNTIILKLKPEFKNLQTDDGIVSDVFNYFLTQPDNPSLLRVFPNHHQPETVTNEFGDTLVDLSLFYELIYSGAMPEQFLISKFMGIGIFEYVERKPKNNLFFVPNDSLLGSQYYPERVKAFDAWDVEEGDTNVVIGIVDTGTDLLGEDLKDGIKINFADPIDGLDNDNDGFTDNYWGWDFGNGDNNPTSYGDHHGCFTTGISSATVDNGIGISGMGYKTRYLPVKITDDTGYLTKSYEGIVYAADHGAAIINNSWGGHIKNRFGQDIVNYATYNKNALVVGAAGNSGNNWYVYPASFENVISCAATDSLDQRWDYTSFGSAVDIAAPGAMVYSTWTSNGYFASSGTSFAAPGVSAAAALVKSHFPNLTALQIGEQLRVTADNIDTISLNIPLAQNLGAGRLNMLSALTDTLRPSIRFRDRSVDAQYYMPTDTIRFSGNFVNYLHESSAALTATVTSVSPYLSVVNPLKTLGNLSSFANINNYQSPFLLKVSPTTPAGAMADIKITYTDTNYSGFEYFRFSLNPDFINLDTNNIATSVASNGNIGFTDGTTGQGIGLFYKNSVNILSWAGLVIGNSSGKVSSNIYGDAGYDEDFVANQTITAVSPAAHGQFELNSSFDDDGADFTKLSINVEQTAYAYDQNPEDLIFLSYKITNNGNAPLATLYVGFYSDFDIGTSYKNKSATDTSLHLAYTYSTLGGLYAGIMLLDSLKFNSYHIDNDGSNNSINIYDGFPDFEKFNALSGKRDSAGYVHNYGNDVSTMISAGPLNLLPSQSKTITFAILASDHLFGIKKAAKDATDIFYNVSSLAHANNAEDIIVFPNPFNNNIKVISDGFISQPAVFELYSSDGRLVLRKNIQPKLSEIIIETPGLSSGIYFYKLILVDKTIDGKLIKS